MSYITAIKTAIFIFPLIAFIFTAPFILHQYHKYGSINKFRTFIIYSFILYMLTIYFLVILPLPSKGEVVYQENMIHLTPFNFISDFLQETSLVITDPSTYLKALKEPCFYTVVFNIIMFIPFGIYLRYYFKCGLFKTIVFSFLLSLFFEITQLTGLYFIYEYPYRVFDVDDLIINTFGGILGYLIIGLFKKFLPSREEIDEASFKAGSEVSGLRRITLFFLDTFNCLFLYLFLTIFFANTNLRYLTFLIYYIIIPYLLDSKTLGSKFLNIRFTYLNHEVLRNIFRVLFLYLYYFFLPFGLLFISTFLVNYLNLGSLETIWFYIMIFILISGFYLGNILTILKKKKIYYDNFFKVEYESTIHEKDNLNIQ